MPMAPIEQIITWPRFLYTNFLYLTIIQPAEAAYFKTTTVGLVDGIESQLPSSHGSLLVWIGLRIHILRQALYDCLTHRLGDDVAIGIRNLSVCTYAEGIRARTQAWGQGSEHFRLANVTGNPSVVASGCRRQALASAPNKKWAHLASMYPLDLEVARHRPLF